MHRVRVLIVDRQDDHAQTLAMLFEAHDCVVRAVRDGGEAIGLVGGHRPDVLVIDLDVDGTQAIINAARQANPRNIFVVCLTGRRVKGDPECDSQLVKPYDPAELFRRVEEFVKRRGIEKKAANGTH